MLANEEKRKIGPIGFKSFLVDANSKGRKTMTRRPLDIPQHILDLKDNYPGFSVLTPQRHVEWRRDGGSYFYPLKFWKNDLAWVKVDKCLRKASPQTLLINSVRVERLHDISEEHAWREGVCHAAEANDNYRWRGVVDSGRQKMTINRFGSAKNAFHFLWDQCYPGKNNWASNPWVAAYTYTTIDQNIDDYLSAQQQQRG